MPWNVLYQRAEEQPTMRAVDLQSLPFFSELPLEEVQWLLDNAESTVLEEGQYLIEEGMSAAYFHIVLEGKLQLTRSENDSLVSVGLQFPGNFGGVLPLMSGENSPFNIEAVVASRLFLLNKTSFQDFMMACPVAVEHVMSSMDVSVSQEHAEAAPPPDYVETVGKLAASLLHELNLPSKSAMIASRTLIELMPKMHMASFELDTVGLTFEQLEDLLTFEERIYSSSYEKPLLTPEEHTTLEREVSVWLSTRDIVESEDAALTFVSIGITPTDLQQLIEELPPGSEVAVINWLALSLEVARLLDEVRLSTSRVTDLVNAVQLYSFLEQPDREPVEVHEWLDATLKMMRYKLRNVKIIRNFSDDLPHVYGNGTQLGQVWMNLIDNAVDAMEGEGTLTLSTQVDGDRVLVEVQDDGPGIRPQHIDRIFEPFYTTKDVGQGTGLGLDMTYRIITQHDGSIDVQSKPGLTRFIVSLPIG